MGYKYLDEQPAPESDLSTEELHRLVIEMEIKKYGHILSTEAIVQTSQPGKIYSIKEHKLVQRKS